MSIAMRREGEDTVLRNNLVWTKTNALTTVFRFMAEVGLF